MSGQPVNQLGLKYHYSTNTLQRKCSYRNLLSVWTRRDRTCKKSQ